MTNKQWLLWIMIDMDTEEFVKTFSGFMCDICAANILPTNKPCIIDCDTILSAWLKQEHEGGDYQ